MSKGRIRITLKTLDGVESEIITDAFPVQIARDVFATLTKVLVVVTNALSITR